MNNFKLNNEDFFKKLPVQKLSDQEKKEADVEENDLINEIKALRLLLLPKE